MVKSGISGSNQYVAAENFSKSDAVSVSRTGSFELEMTPDEALPLFTAPGEKLWVAAWNPVILKGDGFEKGTVFVTSNHGSKTHWIVMDYDTQNHRALYVRVTPGLDAGTVGVSLYSNGKGGAIVNVSYELTALSQAGNEKLLEEFSESKYSQMLKDWQKMINRNRDKIDEHFSG